jgi:hypothetical protein
MTLFSVLALAGHFFTPAMAQMPEFNYDQICRDSAVESLGVKDDRTVCMQDEATARAELARKWSEFDPAGRATCARISTSNHSGSYVEMLTCLELDRDARKLHKGGEAGIGGVAVEPPRESAHATEPSRTAQVPRSPEATPPVALAAPEAKPAGPSIPGPGFLWILCPPGLSDRLPNCPQPGALPR